MEEEIGCVNDGHYLLTSEDKPVGLGKEVKMRLYSITASQRALLSGRVTQQQSQANLSDKWNIRRTRTFCYSSVYDTGVGDKMAS